MVTVEMIQHCIDNPVKSRHHEWIANQQDAYDALNAKGRTLYDNLRTQFDVSHGEAFAVAMEYFGLFSLNNR
jgi:hypothetical protein